jgi:hypothetical protein
MISVSDKLQGNQTQDLLYQLELKKKLKKEGMKGVYSGETLPPEKQKKLMNDLIEKYLGKSCTCNG